MSQAFNLSQFANKVNTSGQASLTTAVTGLLPVANGGTGTATPSLVGGTNITISGSFPNQTVTATGGGVTSLNGQTGAITNTNYDTIGSYVVAGSNSQAAAGVYLPNVTAAGSSLIHSSGMSAVAGLSAQSGTSNTAIVLSSSTSMGLSGTWRQMSRSFNSTATTVGVNLWVRIS